MTVKQDVVVVDIMQEVVSAMRVPVIGSSPLSYYDIFYSPGRGNQIIKSISDVDNSISMKGVKFPLFALLMPVRESRGLGYYADISVDRIIIAVRTATGAGSESVLNKYSSTGVYKTILYPMYYEFLNQLSRHKNVVCSDPENFSHTKIDVTSQVPNQGSNDYIDSIEILNLEFTLNQIKTC